MGKKNGAEEGECTENQVYEINCESKKDSRECRPDTCNER